MHPVLSEQEGNNRKDLEDQNGVMVTQEVVKAAESGGGYHSFYFTKADGKTVAPKMAYAEEFEPWGWAVATGNYVDDMQAEMEANNRVLTNSYKSIIRNLSIMSVIMLVIAVGAAILVGSRISILLRDLKNHLNRLQMETCHSRLIQNIWDAVMKSERFQGH